MKRRFIAPALIIVIALGSLSFLMTELESVNHRSQVKTNKILAELDYLNSRIATLQSANQSLSTDAAQAKTQANASVDQLVHSGIQPIVAAPNVVTVPTAPLTTTTQPPVFVPVPVPARTTLPPATTEAPPASTTTEAPTTTTSPETTTTTEEPTTTTEPDTTTTEGNQQ